MRKLVSLGVSLGILGLLYARIGGGALLDVFASARLGWLALALALVVPLTLGSAWRFLRLLPPGAEVSLGESTRLFLAASALNMVLPSKLGDLAKAWFMEERQATGAKRAFAVVVFEKVADLFGLLVWCALGLLFAPLDPALVAAFAVPVAAGLAILAALLASRRIAAAIFGVFGRLAPRRVSAALGRLGATWEEVHTHVYADRRRAAVVLSSSILLWLLHLTQIWLFVLALDAFVPFSMGLALAPLAILAGLLPLTLAGIGVRDASLVALYAPHIGAPAAAALGLLCTVRSRLPALGGAPYLGRYLERRARAARAAA